MNKITCNNNFSEPLYELEFWTISMHKCVCIGVSKVLYVYLLVILNDLNDLADLHNAYPIVLYSTS